MRFYKNQEIEGITETRLLDLEKALGEPLSPPIPIDVIAERVLGLDFLWEPIEEFPGEIIFGALVPDERQIVLNENRLELFKEKPGLERSTKGHEIGHWDLYFSKANLDHPTLFDMDDQKIHAFRSSPLGEVTVLKALIGNLEYLEILEKIGSRADEADEARTVNRYAAALSMPKNMITEDVLKIDRTEWKNLYPIAKKYDVTITALRVRLEQLNLLYVDKKTGKLYPSREQAFGQQSLY